MLKTKLSNPKFNLKVLGVFVLIFAAVGSYTLLKSHAALPPPYLQFLNYQSAAQTTGVSNVSDYIDSIGAQTVSQVAPGGQLTYLVGGKTPTKTLCYFIRAGNTKGVGTVATVQLTNQYDAATISLPINYQYQRYCVVSTSTSGTLKPYNVYNKSAVDGPNVLIYQTIVSN
jgi:hypothetical protein